MQLNLFWDCPSAGGRDNREAIPNQLHVTEQPLGAEVFENMVTTWPRKPHRPGFLARIKFKPKVHIPTCSAHLTVDSPPVPPNPPVKGNMVGGQQSDKKESKTVETHPYISAFVTFLTLLAWFTLKQRKGNLVT